jgi:choline dehydrogenase-like flavoprotein
MTHDIVDVLIVGAGASGAAVAYSLADTRMRIMCMEQGEWMNPAHYASTRSEWEYLRQSEYSLSPNVRKRAADYPINDSESPIAVANFNAVGGSTIIYAAHFPRLHPSDFKVRTLDGVADDWPISYAELEPFFAENDRVMGVAGLAGDPAYPHHEPPMPPIPLGRSGETMARGFNKLGWHWWPADSAIATQQYEGREQCANLGPCMGGCAKGAKASTDITYWPLAVRNRVELKTRCRVSEVTVAASGLADGVTYFDESGVEQHQRAHIVIMACNGVGTPRVLLNSTSAKFPNGLANSSGMVGKNLMMHPWGRLVGVFDEDLASHYGPEGCCLWSQEFYETDPARDFVRGYNLQVTRGPGPVGTALFGNDNAILPWGENHHDAYARLFDRSVFIGVCCEDLPEAHNRVTLDDTLTDSNGIPAPKVAYQMSENSRRMMAHAFKTGTQVLEAAGASKVYTQGPIRMAGWHLLGTARMGNDPETSVVNGWGRAHDVRNLFIVDGSVFVTSGGVNPTTTLQAVALYIADKVKANLANLFD